LAEAHERLDRQRRLLGEELARAQNLERLRWEGEMIYGFLHTIGPGQTTLEVEGHSIALDPAHTPVENAQARFHAYDKAKSALAGVPERLAATEARLAGLDETLALLDLAEGFEAIEGIAREAVEQGYLKAPEQGRKQPRARRQPPLRVESSDGYPIYVGRSAGQNEQVTFKIAAPEDLWLHAHGIPGAHVVIKRGAPRSRRRCRDRAARPGAASPWRPTRPGNVSRRARRPRGSTRAAIRSYKNAAPRSGRRVE
jgi:predicted ribosome quality control (RQC) complex YloA/Tae2 family protein